MRLEREALLHMWIADGRVECHTRWGMGWGVTEYRVVGTKEWWSDRRDLENFPSVKLIATLALGVAALQPPMKPITPQWQHAWKIGAANAIEGFDV